MAIIGEKITLDKTLVGNIARNQMESKMELTTKGALYVGTGETNSVIPDGGGTAVPIPITSHIAPNGADDNGKVLVADASKDVGWKVAKITADNLEGGRVAQATNADNVLVSTDTYQPLVDALLALIYPVGSIYMSVNDTNPADFLGGTWERWGQDRVPVGVSANANDSDFGKVEQQGGERKHQLITSEMPAHNHRGTYTETQHHTINIPGSGDSFIEMPSGTDAVEVKYEQTQSASLVRNGSRPIGQQLDIDYTEKVTALYGVPSQGGNAAHNNLQPYITCYMWKRTA